jgi:phosphate-selective porin OprO and OprP
MLKHTLHLALATVASAAFAGTGTEAKTDKVIVEKDWCESLWEIPTIYKGDGFVKEVRIIGRFHGDVYSIDSAQGYDSDWVVRRLRAGALIKLQGNLEIKAEASFDPQFDNPWYNGMTDLYIRWKPSDAFALTVGKQGMPFTLDGAMSSNTLQTLERSNVSNNFWFNQEYFSAISVSGKINEWQYYLGVASNDVNEEFGDFDASYFGVASVGYDFGKALGAKKALLRLDYVYQDTDPNAVLTRPFEHIGSLNFNYDQGKWGFLTDLSGGIGDEAQSDAWGIYVMPWYKLTDKLEVVARYTHIESSDPDGVRLNGRYEGRIVGGRGDEYDEAYVGLNYYICGHKLKLQTGWTYATMEDSANNGGRYDGWAWTTGVRFSF